MKKLGEIYHTTGIQGFWYLCSVFLIITIIEELNIVCYKALFTCLTPNAAHGRCEVPIMRLLGKINKGEELAAEKIVGSFGGKMLLHLR